MRTTLSSIVAAAGVLATLCQPADAAGRRADGARVAGFAQSSNGNGETRPIVRDFIGSTRPSGYLRAAGGTDRAQQYLAALSLNGM